MPFYWQGIYFLFYLYKYCVYVVETKDFVHFEKPYLSLQNGSLEEQDWHIATGSVFHHEGTFYFHYTGFCEGFYNADYGNGKGRGTSAKRLYCGVLFGRYAKLEAL